MHGHYPIGTHKGIGKMTSRSSLLASSDRGQRVSRSTRRRRRRHDPTRHDATRHDTTRHDTTRYDTTGNPPILRVLTLRVRPAYSRSLTDRYNRFIISTHEFQQRERERERERKRKRERKKNRTTSQPVSPRMLDR